MAIRVDTMNVERHRTITLGKRRFNLAGLGEKVKVVIGAGFITLYPEHAKLCTACGELVALNPQPTEPDYCMTCVARIGAQLVSAVTTAKADIHSKGA